MDLIFNKNLIHSSSSALTSHQGALFYSVFKSVLSGQLVACADGVVGVLVGRINADWSTLARVLTGMVDHVGTNRTLRKKYAPLASTKPSTA